MELIAPRSLKYAYAIVILAVVFPFGLASSGWVALTLGSRGVGIGGIGMGMMFIGPLLLLALGVFRLFTVFGNPQSLDSPAVQGSAAVLRKMGVLALYIGAVVSVFNLVSRPLMAAFITHRSDSGVEFYVAGTILALLSGIGTLGLIAFELSRILGIEQRASVTAES